MVAMSWQWFLRLARRGKDATRFVSALADYAARRVKAGRLLCGRTKTDALSHLAQQQHPFTAGSMVAGSARCGNHYDEALQDNTQTPVPDQVGFRCDFPAWRRSRSKRDRRLIDDLMMGETTMMAARRHGLTPSRVSQLRREFMEDWLAFCNELPEQMARLSGRNRLGC